MNQPTSLARLQNAGNAVAEANTPDYAVDMFTEKGFALANRIAKAYASSDAVPSQFRMVNMKRQRGANSEYSEVPVPNDAAIANCLVAIEVARAVGMSITAVMQNADMIEGKLRWSGKFVIAAINASGRFSPLRFQMKNLGAIKATYKEKGTWNREDKRYNMVEKTVDVDNIQCIAWALPKGYPEPRPSPQQMVQFRGRLLDLYKELGAPVIESAPVSMRMVVEEGWYAKAGSKWQTEMRDLMFMYRAGSFFGNIHAPDIVMGMGRTSEEERDITTVDVSPTGEVLSVTPEQLRGAAVSDVPMAERVEPEHQPAAEPPATQQAAPTSPGAGSKVDTETGEITPAAKQQAGGPPFDVKAFSERMTNAKTEDALNLLADELRQAPISDDEYQLLVHVYQTRLEGLQGVQSPPADATKPTQQQPASTGTQTRRRPASGGVNSAE